MIQRGHYRASDGIFELNTDFMCVHLVGLFCMTVHQTLHLQFIHIPILGYISIIFTL